jgi:pimeloyl-ACP methyl ester carboxylesterase
MGSPPTIRIAHTGRGPVEYRLTGSGPTVLVLKGGHSTRDTQVGHQLLADHGFTVLEASRPGYDSTPASVGRTAQAAADALAALIDALGLPSVDLIAISAAGHTALELARRHPARIRRVSFESAVALPWDAPVRLGGRLLFGPAQRLLWGTNRAALRLVPDATLRFWLSQLTILPPAEVVHAMDPLTRIQYLDVFRSLRSGGGFRCDLAHTSHATTPLAQPVLIFHGRHDRAVPATHAARLAALCPNHHRVELDAETHFIWFGRAAAEVWDRRLAFLRG